VNNSIFLCLVLTHLFFHSCLLTLTYSLLTYTLPTYIHLSPLIHIYIISSLYLGHRTGGHDHLFGQCFSEQVLMAAVAIPLPAFLKHRSLTEAWQLLPTLWGFASLASSANSVNCCPKYESQLTVYYIFLLILDIIAYSLILGRQDHTCI
jgi:hypothetical protein